MSKKEKSVQLDANGYRKFSMLDNVSYRGRRFRMQYEFCLKEHHGGFWTQFMQMDSIMYAGLFSDLPGLGRHQRSADRIHCGRG